MQEMVSEQKVQKKMTAREKFSQQRREMTVDFSEGHGSDAQKNQGQGHPATSRKMGLDRAQSSFSEAPAEPTGLAALEWTAWLPWNWGSTYQIWKESRVEMWESLYKALENIEIEEHDGDSAGNRTGRITSCRRRMRRLWRIFVFAYWDPFLDILPTSKTAWMVARWTLILVPLSGFVGSGVLLVQSILRNEEYKEGDCQIDSLPETFRTQKGVDTDVTGTYTIRRFYQPSSERTEGFVLQTCAITVPCEAEEIALTGFLEGERCEKFRLWAWRDPILCYFHVDDEYGTKGRDLLCLSKPSDLQEEMFLVIIAGAAVIVAILIVIAAAVRTILDQKEHQLHLEELERELEKERVEAEERELEEEAKRQQEMSQKLQEEDENERADLDDVEWANDKTRSFLSQVTRLTFAQSATQSATLTKSKSFAAPPPSEM